METSQACIFFLSAGKKRVLWEITNKCNARCKHCCSNSTEEGLPNELSSQRITKLLEELRNFGFNQIYFTGGEPLLKHNFINTLTHTRQLFDDVVLSTNGGVIDENIADKIATIGLDYVSVSIDSFSSEKHDIFRGGTCGLHNRACNAVKLLSSRGVRVIVACTITNENSEELENMLQLAKTLNANALLTQFFLPVGRAVDYKEFFISGDKRKTLEEKIYYLKQKCESETNPIKIKYKRFLNKGTPLEKCLGGDRFLYITAEGKVGPCPWICKIEPKYMSSNTLHEHSFESLFNSIEIQHFKDLLNKREQLHNYGACEIKDCKHGCPAIAKIYKGNFMEFDLFCDINIKD